MDDGLHWHDGYGAVSERRAFSPDIKVLFPYAVAMPSFRSHVPQIKLWGRAGACCFWGCVIALSSYRLTFALLTGEIEALRRHGHEIIAYAADPWRFSFHFGLYLFFILFSWAALHLMLKEFRELRKGNAAD